MVVIIFVHMVVKQSFILILGILDDVIIIVIGPDRYKMLIQQMFANTDMQGTHQNIVFIIQGAWYSLGKLMLRGPYFI